jgi:hypothetical protein
MNPVTVSPSCSRGKSMRARAQSFAERCALPLHFPNLLDVGVVSSCLVLHLQTPIAYTVASVLHRPVESAAARGHGQPCVDGTMPEHSFRFENRPH